jgi:MHS family alpha-ketoglutarate permease-like MFS transporter
MDNSQTLPLGSAAAPAKERTTASRIKSIFSGSVGNMVEWYDWYVYAAFSLYFAKAFFPKGDTTAQLLNTAAIFAVGFLMRPIGGWLMGLYADKAGRKKALMASVYLMCFGSLLIALSPGYETIGIGAPILLIFARLLQGLSVGGEYGTSATYLSEMATKDRRGFYSSFQYVTLISGQLIALAVLIVLQQTLTTEQLYAWGWRIPFAIGALCAVVALYLRRGMEETESFTKKEKAKESAMRTLLRHPKELMTVVGLTMGGTLAFYTYTTYMQKFLKLSVGLSDDETTMVTLGALLFGIVLQPIYGAISDRIGRKWLLIAFGVSGVLFTIPLLRTLEAAEGPWTAFLLIAAAWMIVSGYTSINAVVKAELFPARIRALGVGLPYALTVAIFGGTTEYVALWLKKIGHESWFFYYVAGAALVSLLVYVFMGEPSKRSQLEREADELRELELASGLAPSGRES